MLTSLFKGRIGVALVLALVLALMLPAAVLGDETAKPKQKSVRSQTVTCSTTTTTPDGKTIKDDCSPELNGSDNSSTNSVSPSSDVDFKFPDESTVNPLRSGEPTPDTFDSWLNGMMNDLFWAGEGD
jgi:hypothetical protein